MMKIPVLIVLVLCLLESGVLEGQGFDYVNSILWSRVNDIKVSGNYAYCAFPNGLVVFDISEAGPPIEQGRLYCQGTGLAVDIFYHYAVLADENGGVRIIDVSNPSTPRLTATFATWGAAYDLMVKDDYAYIATGMHVQVIDLADPASPVLVGNYANDAEMIYVSGNLGVIGTWWSMCKIIDISDPSHITPVSFLDPPGVSVEKYFLADDYLYLGTHSEGLLIYDITEPGTPKLAGQFPVESYARDLQVRDDYVFLAEYWNGLWIIDVSDHGNPVLRGELDVGGQQDVIDVQGDYVYLSDRTTGINRIEISDIENPTFAGRYLVPQEIGGFFVADEYAYLANGNCEIFDISIPEAPVHVASFDPSISIADIFVSGEFGYVINGQSMMAVLDLSNRANPEIIGMCGPVGASADIYVVENFAYMASYYDGLNIVDVSDPTAPEFVARFETEDVANAVRVRNDYAFIANGALGLIVVDVSDPENPQGVSNYPTDGYYWNLHVDDEYAYIADGFFGLRIIDISDPFNPVNVSDLQMPPNDRGIVAGEDLVFMGITYEGLYMIDISDRAHPSVLAGYDTPFVAGDVRLSGDLIFLNDRSSLILMEFNTYTGVREVTEAKPDRLEYFQNYPNPFNPSTTFSIALPRRADVRIEVYNVIGQKVITLLNGIEEAGYHSITWDASVFPSGVYFARLETGGLTGNLKLVLLK